MCSSIRHGNGSACAEEVDSQPAPTDIATTRPASFNAHTPAPSVACMGARRLIRGSLTPGRAGNNGQPKRVRRAYTVHMTSRAAVDPSIRSIGERLIERFDFGPGVAALRRLPGLGAFPPEAFTDGVRTQAHRAFTSLFVLQEPPSPETLRFWHTTAKAYVAAGIPIASALEAQQITQSEFWRQAAAAASRLRAGPSSLVRIAALLIEANAIFNAITVDEYRTWEAERARESTMSRQRLLERLLLGRDVPEATGDLELVGLSPGATYVAIRTRAYDPDALLAVERMIVEESGRRRAPLLIGTIDGDAACITTPGLPQAAMFELDASIAIGPEANLSALPESFRMASRVLETAIRFGYKGIATVDDLGPRLAVRSDADVSNHLEGKCLRPLDAHGRLGALIEETLRVYLEENLRVDATAARLFVHRNTIQLRLRRYEEITGIDVRGTSALVEIWWALAARDQRASPLGP